MRPEVRRPEPSLPDDFLQRGDERLPTGSLRSCDSLINEIEWLAFFSRELLDPLPLGGAFAVGRRSTPCALLY
jgi:hypothetical protein